jgi:predicted acetyltransferase
MTDRHTTRDDPSQLAIRPGTADDWPAVVHLMASLFHNPPEEEFSMAELYEPERSLVSEDGGTMVGHAVALTRDLTVPGGTVPTAHVTMVGVAPTHRRRGLLTQMMHRQLREVSEPIAALWASEGAIYPRFGYGMATQRVGFAVDTREVRLPEPTAPGRLRTVPLAEARPALMEVYEAARPHRPGWSSRNERWWDKLLADPAEQRAGATERRLTVHDGAAGPDGYALWRVKGEWGPGGPQGEVRVTEVVATTPDAELALWRFLLAIDLTRSVTRWLGGLDDPLLYLASDPRRLGTTLGDGLFVRIVDLPAALSARRYAAPVDVVLEVADPLLPGNAGRWRLVGDSEKATCTRTDQAADLACGIAELGAAYLGGIRLAALGAAGRVFELRPETLAPTSTALGWHRAPAGLEIF